MSKNSPTQSLYIAKLASSNLSEREASKLNFKLLSPEQSEKLGHKKLAAFQIPYHDLKGRPTKFYRIRYLESTKKGFAKQTDAKDQRYDQPSGATTEVYFPTNLKRKWTEQLEKDEPLFITEGELKAACAVTFGFPTIALGGVWNFCARKKGVALLPVFKEMNLTGKRVYIVFDSDAAANPQVAAAENELCRQLLNLKVQPHIIRLPSLDGNKKTGLDDYLIAEGGAAFEELIERASEFQLAKELLSLNEEVIYVENPSLVMRRRDGYKMSVQTFKNEVYADKTFIDFSGEKPKRVKTAEEWVRWEGRAVVNKFVYEPGAEEVIEKKHGLCLNMWRGMPYEPKKGDIKPWLELMDYFFRGDEAAKKWFQQWCAFPFRYPGVKLFTAAVIWSVKHGTGKTLVGHTLQRLYGEDNSIIIRSKDLERGNNSFAENKQFVLGEEITGDERRGLMDDLKALITNEELRINIKYVPEYTTRSCANYYFTSNNPDAFFLDESDRRFFVQEIQGSPLPEAWYTGVYDPWYKSDEGAAALLHHFMTFDLEGFDPRKRAPMTRAKSEMIENSRSILGNWVHRLREEPDSVLAANGNALPYKLWSTEDLLHLFDPEGRSRVGVRGLSVELKRAGFNKAAQGQGCRTKGGQVKLWPLRDVEETLKLSATAAGKLYDEERAMGKKPKFAKKKEVKK